jgi:hypothetical protein
MKSTKQKGGSTLEITNDSSGINNKKEPVVITRIPYDIKIFSFFCILGLLVRILFAGKDEYATATVWGYGFSVLALLGLVISSFAMSSKSQFSQGVMGFFKALVKTAGPLILTILILSLVLSQNISFFDHINSGKVAPQYYQFSGVSGFLVLVQACLVINYLMDTLKGKKLDGNGGGVMVALASELNSIILILTVANIGFIGILQVMYLKIIELLLITIIKWGLLLVLI